MPFHFRRQKCRRAVLPTCIRLSAWLACAALAASVSAQEVPVLPYEQTPFDTLALDQALDRVLAFELSYRDADKAVVLAGRSRDTSLVPRLKAIVERYAPEGDPWASSAYYAVVSLRMMGEGDD